MFSSGSGASMTSRPLSSLVLSPDRTDVFVSPLATPVSIFNSPLGTPPPPQRIRAYNTALSNPDTLMLRALEINTGDIEVQSVCVRDVAWSQPPVDTEDATYRHPVCQRDYAIHRSYNASPTNDFRALLIGTARHGMPVHAIAAGQIVAWNHTYTAGADTYDGCITISHNNGVQSVTCNLSPLAQQPGVIVASGSTLGFTSEQHSGLALVAMMVHGDVVNPATRYTKWGDCRPYRILCTLVPLLNEIIVAIENIGNVIVEPLAEPFRFIYRIGELFGFVIKLLTSILSLLVSLIQELFSVISCVRSLIGFFIASMYGAANPSERVDFDAPSVESMQFLTWVFAVINQSFLVHFLNVVATAIIAVLGWRLIVFGIEELQNAIFDQDIG